MAFRAQKMKIMLHAGQKQDWEDELIVTAHISFIHTKNLADNDQRGFTQIYL